MSAFLKKYYPVIDYLERQGGEGLEEEIGRLMLYALAVIGVVVGVAAVLMGVLIIIKKDG